MDPHFWIVGLGFMLPIFHSICDADLSISTSTHTPCYGDVVTLVCHHPELASNPGRYFSTTPTWRENGVKITPISDTMFEAKTAVEPTHTNLTITITRDYFRNKSFNYSCRLVLAVNGLPGGVETSGEVTVDPVAKPGPPEVRITTTDSTITLTWNTMLRCFESEMFTFVVIWNEIGSGTSSKVTTSSSPYTISGLQPGTSYQISVQGVGGSGVVGGMRVLTLQTPTESPTGGDNPPPAVAIPAAVSVVTALIGVVLAILILVACLQRTRVHGDYDMRSNAHETSGGETVTEVPTPQHQHNIEQFKSDVANTLITVGVESVIGGETGGVPHSTAKYNGVHFVFNCVYTSSDLTLEHVGQVVEAKQVTGSTTGLLLSNQPTIPSECLLTLEDAGCQFVPVSGYGEEGWEDRMIDKVKDVFPRVANDDSERKNLPTSVQESSPPPDDDSERNLLNSEQETSPPPDVDSEPPADPLRSQPHGGIDHTQAGPVPGSFTSTFEYQLEDDDTVP